MSEALRELKARLVEANDLATAAQVLAWDQMTYMPEGGAAARGRHIATLERIAHEKRTDRRVGELLGALAGTSDAGPDGALVRVAKRKYDLARRVPNDFVRELSEHTARSYVAWTQARPENDWAKVAPFVEKTVELSRRYADFFPGYDHPSDPHMDAADEGMNAARVRALFGELRPRLVDLVRRIRDKPEPRTDFLHRTYPIDAQIAFGKRIIERLGYDFRRGRQDFTHHPFMTRFAHGDVRITTRAKENDLGDAFFSTVHEAGHALYEQGTDEAFDGSPLGEGASAGVHESQSRLWENLVARRAGFWRFAFPLLRESFPAQLEDVSETEFVRAANRVRPSLIRVDADEVTYNLHVMIRVGLEMRLLEGALSVRELPEAWHAAYEENLGVRAPDHRDGVLQDVHWYCTLIGGAFQGYTLGNVMSAQFFAAAERANPGLEGDFAAGEFGRLRGWLTEHVYRHGAAHAPLELLRRATGEGLSPVPFATYLEGKYAALYGLG